jgi:hypothetical protein
MNKSKVPAIFSEDMERFLKSINELDAIKQGERVCMACSRSITVENIQLIIPRGDNTFDYACTNPTCIEERKSK